MPVSVNRLLNKKKKKKIENNPEYNVLLVYIVQMHVLSMYKQYQNRTEDHVSFRT